MVGERGGSFVTFDQAADAIEAAKPEWSTLIRLTIESALIESGFFHADDLVALEIPEAHKACVGAQVSGMISRRYMEETGVRRSTSDPAGHARKSAVYRITELGREKLAGVRVSDAGRTGADSGHISPDRSAESSRPAAAEQNPAGNATLAPAGQLFETPEAKREPGYIDPDMRAA